jgi:flavin reductase (DIM6/NTAB) family NADH-FMN oxidoreductase RutF
MEISSNECTSKDIYKLLTGIIVPRPIAFVSTKNAEGKPNVAPFSFFNAISSDPPIVMFSAGDRDGVKKDTIANIEEHPEFVINVVTEEMAQQMHDSAANFRPEISEFEEVGLTPIPAQEIDGFAVKEAPAHMECKLHQIIRVGKTNIVLGEVVHFRLDNRIYLGDFKTDVKELKPLARLAGNGYGRVREHFELERHFDPNKVIK